MPWMSRNTFCWRIRKDFMTKVQLKCGKQYLRGGTEMREHRNMASVHLASRCSVQRQEKGPDSEAQAGRNKIDVDKESTLQATGKEEAWGVTEWTLWLIRQLSEGQNDRRAVRDEKTRHQRPGNKTFMEKEEEKNVSEKPCQEKTTPVLLT